jgi:hypothetical protein
VIPIRRLPLLVLAALAVSACSEIDCTAPQRYHGAQLEKRLTTPEGLSVLQPADTHAIPGGPPPDGYISGACLVKPPQTVAMPEPGDD